MTSIFLICTMVFVVDRQYQEQSIVLKCIGYSTNEKYGVKHDDNDPYQLEEIYNFSNDSFLGLYDDWKMIQGEYRNGIEFTNQEFHFNDFGTLESVYVNKDHISIISTSIRDDLNKKKEPKYSEKFESIDIDRNSGKWNFSYQYKERDKNNKLIYDLNSHVIGSCERIKNKL